MGPTELPSSHSHQPLSIPNSGEFLEFSSGFACCEENTKWVYCVGERIKNQPNSPDLEVLRDTLERQKELARSFWF